MTTERKKYFREPALKKSLGRKDIPSEEDPTVDDAALERALLRHGKFAKKSDRLTFGR